jgi:hypothetical protein
VAHVVRDAAEVPPEADDPPANHDALENEMIARMPHQSAPAEDLPSHLHDGSRCGRLCPKSAVMKSVGQM